jgi:hypothetical protein
VHHPRLQQLLALPDGDTYLEAVALLHEALLHGYSQAPLAATAGAGQPASSSSSEQSLQPIGPAAVSSSDVGDIGVVGRAAGQRGVGSYLATLPVSVPLPVFAGGR